MGSYLNNQFKIARFAPICNWESREIGHFSWKKRIFAVSRKENRIFCGSALDFRKFHGILNTAKISECNSVGRVSRCQRDCRRFESVHSLHCFSNRPRGRFFGFSGILSLCFFQPAQRPVFWFQDSLFVLFPTGPGPVFWFRREFVFLLWKHGRKKERKKCGNPPESSLKKHGFRKSAPEGLSGSTHT